MPPVEAYPPGETSLEEERKYLEDMIRDLEREMGAIRDRIKELGPKE
jgi:prefoldin subunit 5